MWRSIFCIAFIFFIACDRSVTEKQGTGKLYIVTTTSMIADAVLNIGGDRVQVDALMGPGVDPHLYKATASDTVKLSKAEIIFYNGLHLEGKMGDILEKLEERKPVYAIADAISRDMLRSVGPEIYDPHIWFDIALWDKAVKKIADDLAIADSKNSAFYEERCKKYREELRELHEWTISQIESIEKDKRVLVTAHDAFGYFGEAYGMKVVGLQGISTSAEYGVKDVEKVIALLVGKKIQAIFVESSVPAKTLESVLAGCKNQNHEVKIGGSLFSDAMGDAGTPEGTYIGMVKHNVNTIVKALSE